MNKNSIYFQDTRQIAISLARFALNEWNTFDFEVLKVNGLLPSQINKQRCKMKYTKRHVDSKVINSLFTPGGTISEKQAKDIIIEKAKREGASLSGYFK